MINQPGDFQSDAQFFVFTGVIAWLGATACLVIYVFFSQKYLGDDKKAPMVVCYSMYFHSIQIGAFPIKPIYLTHCFYCNCTVQDFCFTVIVAVFWLAASAAWANGVIGLKNAAASENWLFDSKYSVCHKGTNGYDKPRVDHCDIGFNGSYGGANASIVSN